MPDIITFGEALIDFICTDGSENLTEAITFSKKAGGAPANVAAGLGKLGAKVLLISKTGKDPFGIFLKSKLENMGVDCSFFILDKNSKTSLAFVSIGKDGERDFTFFREKAGDTLLRKKDISISIFKKARIFHFGSISLIKNPTRKTLIYCLKKAKQNNLFITYDPNIRLNLWKNEKEALQRISDAFKYADLVKLSDSEVELLSREKDLKKGLIKLKNLGPKIIIATLGKDGALLFYENNLEKVEGLSVKVVDTTGAGDGFMAGLLYKLNLLPSLKKISPGELKDSVAFANKVGAMVTTKYGAMEALPGIDEVGNICP